jgi:hypothetical protein
MSKASENARPSSYIAMNFIRLPTDFRERKCQ